MALQRGPPPSAAALHDSMVALNTARTADATLRAFDIFCCALNEFVTSTDDPNCTSLSCTQRVPTSDLSPQGMPSNSAPTAVEGKLWIAQRLSLLEELLSATQDNASMQFSATPLLDEILASNALLEHAAQQEEMPQQRSSGISVSAAKFLSYLLSGGAQRLMGPEGEEGEEARPLLGHVVLASFLTLSRLMLDLEVEEQTAPPPPPANDAPPTADAAPTADGTHPPVAFEHSADTPAAHLHVKRLKKEEKKKQKKMHKQQRASLPGATQFYRRLRVCQDFLLPKLLFQSTLHPPHVAAMLLHHVAPACHFILQLDRDHAPSEAMPISAATAVDESNLIRLVGSHIQVRNTLVISALKELDSMFGTTFATMLLRRQDVQSTKSGNNVGNRDSLAMKKGSTTALPSMLLPGLISSHQSNHTAVAVESLMRNNNNNNNKETSPPSHSPLECSETSASAFAIPFPRGRQNRSSAYLLGSSPPNPNMPPSANATCSTSALDIDSRSATIAMLPSPPPTQEMSQWQEETCGNGFVIEDSSLSMPSTFAIAHDEEVSVSAAAGRLASSSSGGGVRGQHASGLMTHGTEEVAGGTIQDRQTPSSFSGVRDLMQRILPSFHPATSVADDNGIRKTSHSAMLLSSTINQNQKIANPRDFTLRQEEPQSSSLMLHASSSKIGMTTMLRNTTNQNVGSKHNASNNDSLFQNGSAKHPPVKTHHTSGIPLSTSSSSHHLIGGSFSSALPPSGNSKSNGVFASSGGGGAAMSANNGVPLFLRVKRVRRDLQAQSEQYASSVDAGDVIKPSVDRTTCRSSPYVKGTKRLRQEEVQAGPSVHSSGRQEENALLFGCAQASSTHGTDFPGNHPHGGGAPAPNLTSAFPKSNSSHHLLQHRQLSRLAAVTTVLMTPPPKVRPAVTAVLGDASSSDDEG